MGRSGRATGKVVKYDATTAERIKLKLYALALRNPQQDSKLSSARKIVSLHLVPATIAVARASDPNEANGALTGCCSTDYEPLRVQPYF